MPKHNRQVMHVFPVRMADTPPEHRLPDGTMRPHNLDRETAHTCWCGPTVLEWRDRGDGRMAWAIVKEGES